MIGQKNSKSKNALMLFCLIPILLLNQCENKINPLGEDILPPNDKLSISSDTIMLTARNRDKVINAASNASILLLGSYEDDIFGFAKADFFLQLAPEDYTDTRLYQDLTVDSARLFILPEDFYGNKKASFNVELNMVNADLPTDTGYFSDFNADDYYTENIQIIDGNFSFTPEDSILSIPVSMDFVNQYLLSADVEDSVYSAATDFLDYFKGFYFTINEQHTSDGAIEYLNITNKQTRLSLYYTKTLNDEDIVDTINFKVDDNCTNISVFECDNLKEIKQRNTSDAGDDWIYIQSLGGVSAEVDMKKLYSWTDSMANAPIIINKAEVLVDVIDEGVNIEQFTPADPLTFTFTDEFRVYDYLPDAPCYISDISNEDKISSRALNYYGGNYDSDTKSYDFRISRYVQSILDNELDTVTYFNLFPGDYDSENFILVYNSSIAERVIIDKDIKLIITYSETNN